MKLTIEIDLDGSAFETAFEDAHDRLLVCVDTALTATDVVGHDLSDPVYLAVGVSSPVKDFKGNTCGFMKVTE
jgi:hypothetical protein